MDTYIKKAETLIETLSYIQSFRGATTVIKFGGSVLEDKELAYKTLKDIVFLECVGMKPVIVHGGGKSITARLKELEIETKFINGQRYTCEKSVKVVDDVLHNDVNKFIVETITELKGKAITLSGKDIFSVQKAKPTQTENGEYADLGFVGDIYHVDTKKINYLLDKDIIPVITPLGLDFNSYIYNINADIAAAETAEALKARKLLFISDVPGILLDPKDETSRISTINIKDINQFISKGIISGGMIPKINSAAKALKAGTNKVHMIDGRTPHSILLEIFTTSGVGTQILKDNSY